MKKGLLIAGLLIVVAAAGWYFYTKNANAHLAYIPDCAGVMLVDVKSIAEKGNFKDLDKLQLWKEFEKEAEGKIDSSNRMLVQKALQDPLSTGIDFRKSMAAFVSKEGNDVVAGVVIALVDAEKFSATVASVPKEAETMQGDGYKYVMNGKETSVFGWNNDVAVFYVNNRTGDLLKSFDSLIHKKVAGMAEQKTFKKFVKHTHDLDIYLDNGKLSASEPMTAQMMSGMNLPADYAVCLGVNFENGKITAATSYYFNNKEDEKKFDWVAGKPGVNPFPYLCAEPPVAVLSININYPQLYDFLSEIKGVKENVDQELKAMQLTQEQVRGLLTGQVAFSFSGVVGKQLIFPGYDGSMDTVTRPMPLFSLFVGIKDKASFKKLLEQLPLQKTGNYYQVPVPAIDLYMAEGAEGITFTTDVAAAEKLGKGEKLGNGEFGEMTDLCNKNSYAGYVQLELAKTSPAFRDYLKTNIDSAQYSMVELGLKPFENIQSWSGKQGDMTLYTEVNMKDKNTNALSQLLWHIDALAAEERKQDALKKHRQLEYLMGESGQQGIVAPEEFRPSSEEPRTNANR